MSKKITSCVVAGSVLLAGMLMVPTAGAVTLRRSLCTIGDPAIASTIERTKTRMTGSSKKHDISLTAQQDRPGGSGTVRQYGLYHKGQRALSVSVNGGTTTKYDLGEYYTY